MKRLIYILAVTLIFILPSCSPNELPEDVQEEPEYSIDGTLGGENFTIDVGPDNVFIQNDSELEEDEIPTFTVEINGEECLDCAGSLEFVFSGEQNYESGLDFTDLIVEGDYDVSNPNINETIEGLFIDYDNSETTTINIDDSPFSDEFVTLEEGFHSVSIQEFLDPGFEPFTSIYYAAFFVNELGETCFQQSNFSYSDGEIQIEIHPEMLEHVSSILVNDEEISGPFSPLISLSVINDIQLSVAVEYDLNDCMQFESIGWLDFGSQSDLETPFLELSNEFIVDYEPTTVSLVYTSSEGTVYSSQDLQSNSWFQIIDIIPSEDSDVVFDIVFSCLIELVNQDDFSDVITLELENAVIPLVYE